jgi:YHS domain-containing protein
MKRRKVMTVLVAAIIGMGIITVHAAEKKTEVKKQTTCPVMGGKINKAQYADVNGKRIYVCCPGCIGKIKAAPDKYIKQLAAKGITLDKAEMKKMKPAAKKADSHSGHQH